jgi:alkanesulfonate monooxygenase SsuD/methylene tetrahydromethanopterin reductase-like flavin-dependent oxidoreductase (luciferase family)
MLPSPSPEAEAQFEAFRAAAADAGRDASEVGIEATIFASGEDPEAWVEEARSWLGIGATQIMFRPQGDFQTIRKAIARFAPLLGEVG